MRPLSAFALTILSGAAVAQIRPPFDAPIVIADEFRQIVKTLDLNGDGWEDAFGWWLGEQGNPSSGQLHGWINDGAGNLVLAWQSYYSSLGTNPLPADVSAVADIDQDGDDDFAIAGGHRVRVFLSNGAAPPTRVIDAYSTETWYATSIALADFDGDGTPELVLARDDELEIFGLDLANQALAIRSVIATGIVAEGKLVVSDLTGDGELDVLLAGSRVFPTVNGALQPMALEFPLPWGTPITESRRFDAGDVDGDGDLDLVAFTVTIATGVGRYRIVRRTGRSSWSPEPSQDGGPARMLADVDGDGDLDAVCCGGGGGDPDPLVNSGFSAFRIAWNDGTGSFSTAASIPSLGSKAIAGVADLDHDGDADLVAGRCVYYAQGPIVRHPMPVVSTVLQDERTVVDLDGDADPDLEPRWTSVRVNRGDGECAEASIAFPPPIAGTTRVGDPIHGDWDGDGDSDLLARLAGDVGIELLVNDGGGRFTSEGFAAGSEGLGGQPTSAVDSFTADLDADGDLDLIVRTRSMGSWLGILSSQWRNDGTGHFVFVQHHQNQVVTHCADFDGNAVPDLLASGHSIYADGPISWAPGLGGGAFGAWQTLPASHSRWQYDQYAVADADGDGDNDVAAVRIENARPSLYVNDGLGSFTQIVLGLHTAHFTTTPPATRTTAAAGDWNGDGRTDLAFGPIGLMSSSLAILLRTADGSAFEPPIYQPIFDVVGNATQNVRITQTDVDGDGDSDLLTTRLIRSTLHQGEEAGTRIQDSGGLAGLGGVKPLFGARGPFRVGESAQLRLRGLRPGASGYVVVAFPSDPPPPSFGPMQAATPSRIHAQILFTASGAASDPAGSGSWNLEYTVPGYSAGRTKSYMAFVEDDTVMSGYARSNRLFVTYGL